ncbi:Rap1a/Tai family immunity protein [Marinobacter shengliensis]|uniref:Rap1a/Tai family immunity protein n=1 Tax=Marinobacter shengliensis TaxID=1389223 RepID=UPI0035B83F6D
MRFKFFVAFLTVALLVPSFAKADAEEILRQCRLAITDPEKIDQNPILAGIDIGFCFGYLRGLSDYSTGTAFMSEEQKNMIKSCRPERVDNKQLARIVVQFLEDNPSYHHLEQTTLVALALKQAFPCS